MPTYCDECEAVIDRDEELTRIEGVDYCLDCAGVRFPNMSTNTDIDRAATKTTQYVGLLENFQRNRINHSRPKWMPEDWVCVGVSDGNGGTCRAMSGVIACCDEELADTISAAPDLLAALMEVTADIGAYCDDHASDNPTDVTVCLPRLRAAIAKAQGC